MQGFKEVTINTSPEQGSADSGKACGSQQVDSKREPIGSALGSLNQLFHDCLQTLTVEVRTAIDSGEVPVVLRTDDRLLLAVGPSTDSYVINGSSYHELKALAHLPLLAHLHRATRQEQGAVADGIDAALHEHTKLLAQMGLAAQEISAAIHDILHAEQALAENSRTFALVCRLQQQCIEAAARQEVRALLQAVDRMRLDVGDVRWPQTHFVIFGGNQPRYKQLGKCFFRRLIETQSGSRVQATHRVIYSEAGGNLDDARRLIADRLVNGRLARVFLNSPVSLDEDVLGDAGMVAIDAAFSSY